MFNKTNQVQTVDVNEWVNKLLAAHDDVKAYDVLIFKLEEAAEILKKMQDRVDAVRCRERKWYQPDLFANPWGVCFHEDWVANNIGHTVDEDGFCYRGERKVQE